MAPIEKDEKEAKAGVNVYDDDSKHAIRSGAKKYRLCVLFGKTMPTSKRQTSMFVEEVSLVF